MGKLDRTLGSQCCQSPGCRSLYAVCNAGQKSISVLKGSFSTRSCFPISVSLAPDCAWRPRGPLSRALALRAARGFGLEKEKAKGTPSPPCPCGSGKALKYCCEPAHNGVKAAASPEAALRARFSAFKLGLEQFIKDTTHPDYLSFHYKGKTDDEAQEQYLKDIHVGCSRFEYDDFTILATSDLQQSGLEGFVAFQYRSCPKDSRRQPQESGADSEKAESALKGRVEAKPPEKDWKTTKEKARFLKVDGIWKFCDYERREFNLNDLIQGGPQPVVGSPSKLDRKS